MPSNNLYEYYKEQGKSLPSVAERVPLAEQHGIADYTGTAEQNTALLAKLSSGTAADLAPVAPIPPAGGGGLGNFQTVLRSALNEATKIRVQSNLKQLAPLSESTPGGMGFLADALDQMKVRPSVENTFSDIMQTYEAQRKELEFNPNQFRSAQGGIYDIKNNKWVITPKGDGGDSGKTLTRADVEKLKLPISLVGTSWNMFQTQVSSSVPPEWFKNMTEKETRMSLRTEKLQEFWDQFRESFSDTFTSGGGGDSSGSLNYDNL